MPTIEHQNQPSIPGTPVPMASAPSTTASKIAETIKAAAPALHQAHDTNTLESQIDAILAKKIAQKREAAAPKEPDWANITEAQAMNSAIYIPVVDHDIPDYMNMELKDTEYEAVWASLDQRRLGQLVAEGYEVLKPEHVAPNFKLPLLFNSEGQYVYADVVCMRVHKRILYGKRRRALQVSLNQLSNRNRPPRVRTKDTFELSESVAPPVGSFYESL